MMELSVKQKRLIKETTFQVIFHTLVWITVFLTLLPMLLTIMLSLKSAADFQKGFLSFPSSLHFENYALCFDIVNVNLFNSLFCCVVITFFSVLIPAFSAYVFSRYDFPFKNFLFSLILALMMVPGVLTLTSSYLNIQQLNLYNTRYAIILPGIASNFVGGVFLFKTFMGQQPVSLFESAQLDGANDFLMFFSICIPLSVPVLMIQGIGIFAGAYNDYLWPLLVVEDPVKQNLMPLLKDLAYDLSYKYSNEGISYALYLFSGIPLVVTTMIGLKYCISGDFASGMKL
ncbi:MAG: carbohydrate ABC transporter permease [Clostridia bacterium]|nr:carbohydrate ABC transporter permease [Clostridia bacterium]